MIRKDHTKLKTKYSGLSLIEMLITLLIVAIILVVTSSTLVALIKASAISSARALSRDESEFILELLEREIRNASADDISVYNFPDTRSIDFNNSRVTGAVIAGINYKVRDGVVGNEIHIKSSRNDQKWVCIALIKGEKDDEEVGVIIRREVATSVDPGNGCISESSDNTIFISSEEVDIELFEVKKFSTTSRNTTFIIDLSLKPVYWIPGKQSKIKPEYFRQLVVSTGKLTL